MNTTQAGSVLLSSSFTQILKKKNYDFSITFNLFQMTDRLSACLSGTFCRNSDKIQTFKTLLFFFFFLF